MLWPPVFRNSLYHLVKNSKIPAHYLNSFLSSMIGHLTISAKSVKHTKPSAAFTDQRKTLCAKYSYDALFFSLTNIKHFSLLK